MDIPVWIIPTIAAYAALIATASFIWNIINALKGKLKLRGEYHWEEKEQTLEGQEEKLLVIVPVFDLYITNTGKKNVYIDKIIAHVEGMNPKNAPTEFSNFLGLKSNKLEPDESTKIRIDFNHPVLQNLKSLRVTDTRGRKYKFNFIQLYQFDWYRKEKLEDKS